MSMIKFTFTDEGIQQEIDTVSTTQMLTAASMLLVQAADYQTNGDVDKVLDWFANSILPSTAEQMQGQLGEIVEKKLEEVIDESEKLREVGEQAEKGERLRDMDLDAKLSDLAAKAEKLEEE